MNVYVPVMVKDAEFSNGRKATIAPNKNIPYCGYANVPTLSSELIKIKKIIKIPFITIEPGLYDFYTNAIVSVSKIVLLYRR